MCFLKRALILIVMLSAIILPISASGDMSGSGDDASGSGDDASGSTIIIETSGGYSSGYYGGGSSGYTPPITTQRSFTWSNDPSVPQGPSWYENPYETGGKQVGCTVGAAGVAYAGAAATAAIATAPAVAAGAAAAAAIVPIVDAIAELIKKDSAESEAQEAEEAAKMQSQKLKNRKMVQ